MDQIDDPALRAVVDAEPSNVPLLIESYLNREPSFNPSRFTRAITCELLGRRLET